MSCSVRLSWMFDQVHDYSEKENVGMEHRDNTIKATGRKANAEKNKDIDKAMRKKATKDEKIRLMEEKKKMKEVGSDCPQWI